MKFNILFLKSAKGLTKGERNKIKNIIIDTTKKAVRILNLRIGYVLNFTIYPSRGRFTWGSAYSEDWIQLYIYKKEFKEDDLKSAVYHELHHIARYYTLNTERKISFLDTLFSEGLAVVFETEQVPGRVPVYAKYTEAFIKRWIPELKKENLMGSDFSHDEWFWGKRRKPYRLGYKIGTYLVRQIQKNYPKLKSEDLVKKSARDLLKLSKVNL